LQIAAIATIAAALAVAITPASPAPAKPAAKKKGPAKKSTGSTAAKSSTGKSRASAAAAGKKKYLTSSGKAAGSATASISKTPRTKPSAVQSKPAAVQSKPAQGKSDTAKQDPLKRDPVRQEQAQPEVIPAVPTKTVAATAKKPTAGATAKAIPVNTKRRAEAHEAVYEHVATGADIPVENAAALIPFFEQLYRHQEGELPGPLRILHYGDSHTAADEWTGEMRTKFQEKFGDGGSGYSLAGRPYAGYRREDVRSGSTRGWHTDGLVGHPGDGVYGLGGVSMSVRAPHEAVYVEADASEFELYYYQQPGGGSLQVFDNGVPLETISTDGDPSPAYYRLEAMPGPHRVEVETLDASPVRLFGWVAEKLTGVTYEPMGINGASANIILDWNQETLRSNIEHRNPALIVLAYGTNEAGRKDWTVESYRTMFEQLIGRLRSATPTATILIIGPPDRDQRTRKGWLPMDQLDVIVEAQREAALATGCPFWDLRAKMGGKGSMSQWVTAGIAQNDHVHFTGTGYKLLGDAVFRDLMSQYDVFLKARQNLVAPRVAAKVIGPTPDPVSPAEP
jgi:lysophospholipase L1-like esterase